MHPTRIATEYFLEAHDRRPVYPAEQTHTITSLVVVDAGTTTPLGSRNEDGSAEAAPPDDPAQ